MIQPITQCFLLAAEKSKSFLSFFDIFFEFHVDKPIKITYRLNFRLPKPGLGRTDRQKDWLLIKGKAKALLFLLHKIICKQAIS
jgi:hypothetical protein